MADQPSDNPYQSSDLSGLHEPTAKKSAAFIAVFALAVEWGCLLLAFNMITTGRPGVPDPDGDIAVYLLIASFLMGLACVGFQLSVTIRTLRSLSFTVRKVGTDLFIILLALTPLFVLLQVFLPLRP